MSMACTLAFSVYYSDLAQGVAGVSENNLVHNIVLPKF